MKKEMLINVLQPEECRIAILEDGVLEELYVERTSHESYVGNIYKGRVVNIEPSIQAAFIDFGVGRNGFLHVSDVEPAYYRHLEGRREERGRHGNGRDRHRGRDRGPERPGRGERRREERREGRREEPLPPGPPVDYDEDLLFPDAAAEAAPAAEPAPFEEAAAPGAALTAEPAAPEAPAEEAAPEAEPAAEAPKERRRSRGGSRRRREPAAAEAPADQPAEAAPPDAAGEAPSDEPPPDDRPRLMGSAERRTEEGEDEGGEDEGPATQEQAPPVGEDEDLFFPRSRQTAGGGAPQHGAPAEEEAPEPLEAFAEEETREEYRAAVPEEEEEAYVGRAPEREERDFDEERHAEEIADERFNDFDVDELDEDEGPRPREGGRRDRDGGRRNGHGRRRGRRPGGRPGAGRPKPLIQDIFKRGQEVIVQVIKEGIGTKGPTLSTYISIAGRCLVLMPSLNRLGVSRKIQDDEQRRRLREIVNELKPPRGIGFIIRTAAIDRNKAELEGDLTYLSRLWKVVAGRIKKRKAPAEIYQESDMITRTIRDTFTKDIDTIWVDEPNAYAHAKEFLQIVMPRYANRIKLYEGKEPLFHKYGLEEEIARIQQRHVPLPHGGSIVIDQTEALVAIDVNSGNFRADNNAEETAYQMNLQAAKEIARQLRLRDLGGVIVNDFIDMRDEKHRRGVEKALRDAVKRDRARTKVLRISAFGLIEMTRQRIRPSLKRSVYQDCPHCLGTGQVKTCESMSIDVMRLLQLAAHKENVHRIDVRVADDVAHYLLNKKRREITRLEESGNNHVQVSGIPGAPPETLEFVCYDSNNNEVRFLHYDDERARRR
jgi:ribonuclease E